MLQVAAIHNLAVQCIACPRMLHQLLPRSAYCRGALQRGESECTHDRSPLSLFGLKLLLTDLVLILAIRRPYPVKFFHRSGSAAPYLH